MKKIKAIIKPFRLEDVKNALAKLQIEGMTLTVVNGCGHQKGHTEIYQRNDYTIDFLPQRKVELVAPDAHTEAALNGIVHAARTGKLGAGKISITTIDDVLRIRSGERGENGLCPSGGDAYNGA
jgi:nitrogen regulatory protein PII